MTRRRHGKDTDPQILITSQPPNMLMHSFMLFRYNGDPTTQQRQQLQQSR